MSMLNRLLGRRHLRPDQILTMAEAGVGFGGVSDQHPGFRKSVPGLSRHLFVHLDACAECREATAAIQETLETLSAGESEDDWAADLFDPEYEVRQTGQVDWDDFQASVRKVLLARSVRRDSALRRWTGISLGPRPAWTAVAVLLLFAVAVGGGFLRFGPGRTDAGGNTAAAADTGAVSPNTWFMIEETGTLDVEAIAWSDSDIFSAINELDSGEEEALREFILEAAGGPTTDLAPDVSRTPGILKGSPYLSPYLLR